ncbi:MAG: hypothetical protein WCQ41_00355 [Bacillota bacterium]
MKRLLSILVALVLSFSMLGGLSVTSSAEQNMQSVRVELAAKKDVTVYITRTGKKYHKSGCSYLRKSKIAIKLSVAKKRYFTACSRCHPPR